MDKHHPPTPQFWLVLVVVLPFTMDHAPVWVGSGLMSHARYEVKGPGQALPSCTREKQ